MNILVIVITLLMILASVSYSRFEIFNNHLIQQREYRKYVNEEERFMFNQEQSKLYSAASNDERRAFKSNQLNLSAILRIGKKGNSDPVIIERRKSQLEQLIKILYHQAPFFIKLQETHPEASKEMVDAIESGIRKLANESVDPEHAILYENDLAKIILPDPEMQHAFYLMLKGTTRKQTKTYDEDRNTPSQLNPGEYFSLLDFIKYEDKQFSVNAAPPESLEIFFEKSVVEEILEARRNKQPTAIFKTRIREGVVIEDLQFNEGKRQNNGSANDNNTDLDDENE